MKKISKFVTDLGAAAYLMMHKYKVISKKGKSIYFEMIDREEQDFDRLTMDYLSSDFHKFDSCLMSLKKTSDYLPVKVNRFVTDLGVAAYLMMHEYKVIGKKSKCIYFEKIEKKDYFENAEKINKEFHQLIMDYLCSEFHRFDSCLMALKKISEYIDVHE